MWGCSIQASLVSTAMAISMSLQLPPTLLQSQVSQILTAAVSLMCLINTRRLLRPLHTTTPQLLQWCRRLTRLKAPPNSLPQHEHSRATESGTHQTGESWPSSLSPCMATFTTSFQGERYPNKVKWQMGPVALIVPSRPLFSVQFVAVRKVQLQDHEQHGLYAVKP